MKPEVTHQGLAKGGQVMQISKAQELVLPEMKMLHQQLSVLPAVDVLKEIEREWAELKDRIEFPSKGSVAIAVGSRGISNLAEVVRAVVKKLKKAGCEPFIVPAMGSHGGATAEGQTEVLRARGITEETVGAPVRATMEVTPMGEIDGIPLFMNRVAHEADGIVLINRIKPHTNFVGPTESGLIKMIAIGLGNQIGAEHYHRLSVVRDQYEIISSAGRELLKRCRVLFGVGLVENQNHETGVVKMARAEEIESMEVELLKKARACLATLPLDEIDLLIIDEMGKEISGEGIDPNVVGRDVCAYGAERPWPKITRIFVRDLTEASEGSAVGIGQADFTTQRLVDKIDFEVTAINCLTACCPEAGKLPLTYPSDREAIAAALVTLRPYGLDDLRIVYIKNTLELASLMVSKGCLRDLQGKSNLTIEEKTCNWNSMVPGIYSLLLRPTSRLLKNAHLLRCPHPSSLRRTGLYVSLLGISCALYLIVFEQPASMVFLESWWRSPNGEPHFAQPLMKLRSVAGAKKQMNSSSPSPTFRVRCCVLGGT